ncbi:DUF3558 domain-containing protein [Amycolatopsis thailandensis]|nr:DUF3558 domain-containing protein [Amycolatopsis thailandensis]
MVTLILTACTPGPADTPLPGPTATRTIGLTTTKPPYAGAPAVRDPLPATVVAGDPCTTALTPEQVKQVLDTGVTGKRDPGEWPGPTCLWENPVTARTIRVAYATKRRDGLSAVYPSTSPDEGGVWRELIVAGFPAVATTRDPQWHCTVTLGLADDVSAEVSLIGRTDNRGDWCKDAEKTAELVVRTLKDRAGR